MKVLMQARPDLIKLPAGDTIQILKTKEALEGLGVEVDLDLTLQPDLSTYHLVHLFNITRVKETYQQMVNAVEQECSVVLSPIYWTMQEYLEKTAPEKIFIWDQEQEKRKAVLEMANLLLPNAKSEMAQIKMDYKIDTPYQVVFNGVDLSFSQARPEAFYKKYGIHDFVLCVGRISPRKNQLGMIQALRGTGIPLVFIGTVNDPIYYQKCKQAGGEQVNFISHLPHEQLGSAYAASRVHMLASWFDTPGLVNLEAGLAGTNLVVSNRGTAQEYFRDLVWYCSPDEPDSIRSAISEAYHMPKIQDLRNHILQNFTWKKIGEATLKAYHKLLNSRLTSRVH